MERYEINPELECINFDKETPERLEKLEKLKPVDIEDVAKELQEAGYKAIYRGIDLNGISRFKLIKCQ